MNEMLLDINIPTHWDVWKVEPLKVLGRELRHLCGTRPPNVVVLEGADGSNSGMKAAVAC